MESLHLFVLLHLPVAGGGRGCSKLRTLSICSRSRWRAWGGHCRSAMKAVASSPLRETSASPAPQRAEPWSNEHDDRSTASMREIPRREVQLPDEVRGFHQDRIRRCSRRMASEWNLPTCALCGRRCGRLRRELHPRALRLRQSSRRAGNAGIPDLVSPGDGPSSRQDWEGMTRIGPAPQFGRQSRGA